VPTEDGYFLNASLTFSPACFRFPETWSPLPSASSDRSCVAFPVCFFAWPLAPWSLFLILSIALTVSLPSLERFYTRSRGVAYRGLDPAAALPSGVTAPEHETGDEEDGGHDEEPEQSVDDEPANADRDEDDDEGQDHGEHVSTVRVTGSVGVLSAGIPAAVLGCWGEPGWSCS
jgi:hypothetical protein